MFKIISRQNEVTRIKLLRDSTDPFQLPEHKFMKNFRLPRALALKLLQVIEPHLQQRNDRGIPSPVKLCTLLYILAHGTYQTPAAMSSILPSSQPSVSRIVNEIGPIIVDHVMPLYIKFPQNYAQAQRLEFEEMPEVFGIVDGTYINIFTPSVGGLVPPHLYRNRHNNFSLNVMVVVDKFRRFLSINARFPGSVHDAAVWNSSLTRNFMRRQHNAGERLGFLLADKGYPAEPWLLTPHRRPLPNDRVRMYNQSHKENRKAVEDTIGNWKNSMRSMKKDRFLHYSPEKCSMLIYAAATIYNFRQWHIIDRPDPDYDAGSDSDELSDDESMNSSLPNFPLDWNGNLVRANYITNYF